MSWDIVYTAQARQDLRDIYEYMSLELLAPENAAGQAQRIMKMIHSLEEMPMCHQLYGEEPWHSRGIRFLPVDDRRIIKDAELQHCNVCGKKKLVKRRKYELFLSRTSEIFQKMVFQKMRNPMIYF